MATVFRCRDSMVLEKLLYALLQVPCMRSPRMELVLISKLDRNQVHNLSLKDDLGIGIGLHIGQDEKNRVTKGMLFGGYQDPSRML